MELHCCSREEGNSTGRAGSLPEGRALPSGRFLFGVVGARSGFLSGLVGIQDICQTSSALDGCRSVEAHKDREAVIAKFWNIVRQGRLWGLSPSFERREKDPIWSNGIKERY
jgi:hypothetical protein